MSYQLWVVRAGGVNDDIPPEGRRMQVGALTVTATDWETSFPPRMGGTHLVLLGGGDDHVLWRARAGGQERSGLSEGADGPLQTALTWWLEEVGYAYDRATLAAALGSAMGGANLAGLVMSALGLNPPDRRARLGEWALPPSLPSMAGHTTVDWDAQRWQFGQLERGYGVWDVNASKAPVRRFPGSWEGELAFYQAVWELVMEPIVAATQLEGDVAACPVTPRLAGDGREFDDDIEPHAMLVHLDRDLNVISAFRCERRIDTLLFSVIGAALLVRLYDEDGSSRQVQVNVVDMATLQAVASSDGYSFGTPGEWKVHPPGGDRSLAALANWARALVR